MRSLLVAGAALATLAGACGGAGRAEPASATAADTTRLMRDLRVLAADSMEGRLPGTAGSTRARRYLTVALREAGVRPFGTDYARPFEFVRRDSTRVQGTNLAGWVPGRRPGPYLVLTAHYDHVGIRDGQVFNGADDNASGVVAALAVARHFARHRPEYPILIALLDAEEMGLQGARVLVANPPVARELLALNVNLDMVARSERGEIFAAGAHHSPVLRPHLERVAAAAPIRLRLGHDSPDLPEGQDWTSQSDHAVFHAAGIPFVYFGVEDHPDYHRPTDDAERVDPASFSASVQTIVSAVAELNRNLDAIRAASVGR